MSFFSLKAATLGDLLMKEIPHQHQFESFYQSKFVGKPNFRKHEDTWPQLHKAKHYIQSVG